MQAAKSKYCFVMDSHEYLAFCDKGPVISCNSSLDALAYFFGFIMPTTQLVNGSSVDNINDMCVFRSGMPYFSFFLQVSPRKDVFIIIVIKNARAHKEQDN